MLATAAAWSRLVQQRAATSFAPAGDAAGADLLQFVKDEFDTFLGCGVLAHGFCTSCGARRMARRAANLVDLVDHVIPHVPVQHWVLIWVMRLPSPLPFPLRRVLDDG